MGREYTSVDCMGVMGVKFVNLWMSLVLWVWIVGGSSARGQGVGSAATAGARGVTLPVVYVCGDSTAAQSGGNFGMGGCDWEGVF